MDTIGLAMRPIGAILAAKLKDYLIKTITIPTDKPPALLEDSQCFTYAEDLPECFDRSKHSTQETFHDDRHQ